eukprot:g6247.t1
MLFMEHPPPTGFSYCTGQCSWNDTSHAVVNYGFLVKLFSLYPELAANQFFMTGESYAGVLVPTTALQIKAHTTAANRHLAPWSLDGFALGNACPGNRVFTCTSHSGWIGTQVALDFRSGHGMLSEKLYVRGTPAPTPPAATAPAPAPSAARAPSPPPAPSPAP